MYEKMNTLRGKISKIAIHTICSALQKDSFIIHVVCTCTMSTALIKRFLNRHVQGIQGTQLSNRDNLP